MIISKSIRTIASSVLALTLAVTVAPAAHASVFHHTPTSPTSNSGKVVHFSVRNQSEADVELQAGDKVIKVSKGQTLSLDLPVGTRITSNTASAKREAGSVVCEVSTMLKDNTVVLN